MKSIVQRRESQSFAQKLSRLASRLKDAEWRRYGATLLAGKVLGVAITLLIMAGVTGLLFAKVYAADSTVKAADIVNPVNTAWTLIAAFLVFGMQVGFTMLLEMAIWHRSFSGQTLVGIFLVIAPTAWTLLRRAAPPAPVRKKFNSRSNSVARASASASVTR